MTPLNLPQNYSRRVLLRMLVLAAVALALVAWKLDFLASLYFRGQVTPIGWVVNGGIVILFLVGLGKIVALLFRYMAEEAAIRRFLRNQRQSAPQLLEGVDDDSLIAQRYRTLELLNQRSTAINHGALASSLAASLSTQISLPKFVQNILILTGVLGTIISLSIALLGASDMLAGESELAGMSTVIHGMSTALSTTMTAILCYFYFGYFYLKLTDVQTKLLATVEELTTLILIPRFQPPMETVTHQYAQLLDATRELLGRLAQAHTDFASAGASLNTTLDEYRAQQQAVSVGLKQIKGLLRDGFRLPEPPV
jgi:hypothetical protein